MNGRNGTLSPVSTDSTEWSPIGRYQSLDNPYSPSLPPSRNGVTPPASVHSNLDGRMSGGMARNGNPSPPSSVGRSSDGTGLYAQSVSDRGMNDRKMMALEDTLAEHYRVLKAYLGPYLNDEKGNPRPSRAKDKLTRLSTVQFQELSTDVYDESIRRELDRKRGGPGAPGNETPKHLLPKNNFHPKRNQARQKLSTLPLERFRQLATDVFYELERRSPRFTGGDIPRAGSPAGSMASRTSRGAPSRVGTPNSMGGGPRGGRPPPGGYRGPPPPGMMNGPPGALRPGSQPNDLGRPLPKTFQQNTIVPNKGTMVEDEDDSGADDDDAFNLEGAAARRQTNKSAKSMGEAQEKMISDLENQLSEMQGKVGSLEGSLREKDAELQKAKEADSMRDSNTASERAEWDDLRYSLEEKVEKAENLNTSLRSEIDRLRNENADTERSLRAQIADLEANPPQKAYDSDNDEWRLRCEDLERELSEQQQVSEEVRRDAQMFLQEMRELSSRSDAAVEKEERLAGQVSSLEAEVKEWKSRYARAKTQLRSLKASSIGLASLASPDISNYARDATFSTPDGAVKDVHVTNFQLSIDELLQVARRADPEQVLESMRHVVKCVRAITGDIDNTSLSQLASPTSSVAGDLANPEKKLKSRVSATANNLITASKNHASSGGLSPVSLLDAAASHLSTAVVELVKHVKVRPTPEDEFDNDEEDDMPMPLKPNGSSTVNTYNPNTANGNPVGLGLGHQRQRSKGGSSESTRYSAYSSPYSGYDDRQSYGANGLGYERDQGMTEFKNYLEDQTALLVQSIQPLVNLIRSNAVSTPADEQKIDDYIQDISRAVQDTGIRSYDAVKELSSPALKKHAIPVVEVLEDCRQDMLAMDIGEGGRERIPPLAFKTARALKELVLRVDRIETGELTVDQTLKSDF
ncbi:component of the polarisome [Didymosphaeria variabile]|uniref:Component of the polarisome n=1 Tax=Didymosphaeria variabile TaxID=1932322 RepID=A0A9W8XJU5_9PLEO|nr:component of the polarisome [Didymosphaeria variabile]KAJ4351961.1 component of the polarisome [Didymosphaeria variabile]